jgi:hypothetical protein
LDWLTDLFAPVDTVQLPIVRENLSALTAMLSADAMPAAGPGAPTVVTPPAPVAG